jgi:hypothetical protein
MQQFTKRPQPLRWIGIFFLVSAIMFSCENKDKKTTEVQATEVKVDSLPALDKKDSGSTTRPETIKN